MGMNQKQTILEYRTSGQIKGHRPSVVFLKQNGGKVYTKGTADFIMSLGKEKLYFQRLSFFMKRLLPTKDFDVELSRFTSYNLRQVNPVIKCLTIYTIEKYYIEIFYYVNTRDTYESEMNIAFVIKQLEERGVKKG